MVITDEFSDSGMSAQRKYQLRMLKSGCCASCGRKRNKFRHRCDLCEKKRQAVRRAKKAIKPRNIGPNNAANTAVRKRRGP